MPILILVSPLYFSQFYEPNILNTTSSLPFQLKLKILLMSKQHAWIQVIVHMNFSDYTRLKRKIPSCFFCFGLVCLFLGNLPYAKLEQMISLCCLVFSGKNLSVPLLCNARSSMFRYHWYLSVSIFFAQCQCPPAPPPACPGKIHYKAAFSRKPVIIPLFICTSWRHT